MQLMSFKLLSQKVRSKTSYQMNLANELAKKTNLNSMSHLLNNRKLRVII